MSAVVSYKVDCHRALGISELPQSMQAMLVQVSGNDDCFRGHCRDVRRFASRCSANVDNPLAALSVEDVTDKLGSFILQIDQALSGEFLQNAAGPFYPPGFAYEL